jgi:hypothetical protein
MKHILTTRAQVVALKKAGHTQRDTARVIGKPLSFVERWWNRDDLLDRHEGGKPLKITRSLINEVHRRIQKKTRFSSRLVARDMNISQTTVLKAAHLGGLRPYHRAKKLTLSENRKKTADAGLEATRITIGTKFCSPMRRLCTVCLIPTPKMI